jgi:hypothetical protein
MKKFICLIMLMGCSHNVAPTKTPETAKVPEPCVVYYVQYPTASSIKGKVVEGSTWLWNEATQAYEYLTAEETKQKVIEFGESVKKKYEQINPDN